MTDQFQAPIRKATITRSLDPAHLLPELVAAAGERAGIRFLEFFAANIRNPHTRRAYDRAARGISGLVRRAPACRRSPPSSRCTSRPGSKQRRATLAAPTVKQRLAAIRHLFDWLVTGQVVPVNPARIGARAPRTS